MENYRTKLKTLYVINVALTFVMVVIYIVYFLSTLEIFPFLYSETIEIASREIDVNILLAGIAFFISIEAIKSCIRINKTLKNEKTLKEMFVKDNDERERQIQTMSTSIAYRIFVSIAYPASLIIGYFNITICFTIWACILIQNVIFYIFYAYYSKKY